MYTRDDYRNFLRKYNELLRKYSTFISRKNSGIVIPPGWLPLLTKMFELIENSGCSDVVVQQIKEKFGGMRFYYYGGNDELHNKLSTLELSAVNCCNLCGEPVDKDFSGLANWKSHRCEKHKNDQIDFWNDAEFNVYKKEFIKLSKRFNLDPE